MKSYKASDIFAECRQRVTAQEAAEKYGLEVKRGWALCPFHKDGKPSLHFYGGGYKCFSCNASGSVIDFTAQYLGLSTLEAVKRLNDDFSLCLPIDKPVSKTEIQRKQEAARRYEQFERWRHETVNSLNACIRLAHKAEPPFSESEVLAMRYKETFLAWSDALTDGKPQDEIVLYKQRNEVGLLTSQILRSIQTN